jgi:hypothetical protein
MTTRKPDRGRQKPPPVFTLQLTALPNVDAIRALRALLKTALRRDFWGAYVLAQALAMPTEGRA